MSTSAAELRRLRAGAYENARPEVQELVPRRARRILDLGCSSGALGAALKARQGAQVVGVELDPDYAHDAEARLDRVIVADLETIDFGAHALAGIDCVIAADVLEHLRDPWATLRHAAALLAPGGTAVVSLPNIRYWETLVTLVRHGSWPLRDEGIFDRSHLRWFTLSDARALIDQAGLQVIEVAPRYRLRPGDWRSEPQGRRFAHTPLAPFFVFQYVLAAIKPVTASA